ncbi:cuticle collagen 34-like isoform X3 [Poecile atricapillus]|uniref:cuticle collagen 34-like isoform X3 n=1 Tax=Poecile atricapillus TaxID=48891 RepID=UPI0027392319|nr:cuticle collagen 34-like isoform X3 [Poecile atricapillus]
MKTKKNQKKKKKTQKKKNHEYLDQNEIVARGIFSSPIPMFFMGSELRLGDALQHQLHGPAAALPQGRPGAPRLPGPAGQGERGAGPPKAGGGSGGVPGVLRPLCPQVQRCSAQVSVFTFLPDVPLSMVECGREPQPGDSAQPRSPGTSPGHSSSSSSSSPSSSSSSGPPPRPRAPPSASLRGPSRHPLSPTERE